MNVWSSSVLDTGHSNFQILKCDIQGGSIVLAEMFITIQLIETEWRIYASVN